MIKFEIKKIAFSIIFLGFIVSLLYLLLMKKPSSTLSISCTSSYSSHVKNEVLKVLINYRLVGGKGFVAISGALYNNDVKISDVNLDQSFHYTNKGGDFIFTRGKDDIFETNGSDLNELEKHLYDFYVSNNPKPHHEVINIIKPGVWILLSAPTPYLICIK